jgi:hypothetical protein
VFIATASHKHALTGILSCCCCLCYQLTDSDDDQDVYHDASAQADALADTIDENLFLDADDVDIELDDVAEDSDEDEDELQPVEQEGRHLQVEEDDQGHEETKGGAA